MPRKDSPITPQQEVFCQAVADNGSLSDAYREAYPKSKKWGTNAVNSGASRLFSNSKICIRVAEIKEQLAKMGLWTREQSIAVLSEIAQKSDKDSSRVSAIKELNAMNGHNEPLKTQQIGADGKAIGNMPFRIELVAQNIDSTD